MRVPCAKTIEELRVAVEAFEGCPLKAHATQTVFADGMANAPIMCMGEAPGAAEDIQGKPFVGRSGQLLDKLMAEAGLSRTKNIYITNATFWRPPENRNPTKKELATTRHLMEQHIALFNPKILVPIGNVAMQYVLGTKQGITTLHGTWQRYQNTYMAKPVDVFPLFHPAYLLRNPPAIPTMQADLQALYEGLQARY